MFGIVSEVVRHEAALPENYYPQAELKGIAVAEAAEIHYACAEDATKLYHAKSGSWVVNGHKEPKLRSSALVG